MISSEEIIGLINSINPTAEVSEDTHLLTEGILDSLSIMNLAIKVKDCLKIEISIFDITPENFQTPKTIAELLNSKC